MIDSNECAVLCDQPGQSRWDALKSMCPTLTTWGLNLLQSGLDAYAKAIVVEPRYICKDHRNLHSNFYSKKFQDRTSICSRLHFFSTEKLTRSDLLTRAHDFENDYIGNSIIRPISERCLGRTVIDPYKVGKSISGGNFLLRTRFKGKLNGRSLDAWGYPYMSQDTEATVCAHTALWSMCRYLSERYTVYPETYPYDFITGTTDTNGRTAPYRGMTYTDYSRLLIQFGCHPQILLMQEEDPLDSKKTRLSQKQLMKLCSYVESGFPVLASYRGHVVSIVGHTIDLNRFPVPDADGWIDSSSFLKQFIVVDDNFFPYQLLGDATDPENYAAQYPGNGYSLQSIFSAVCPLPEKVYLPSESAKDQCSILLRKLLAKYPDEVQRGTQEPLVTRLFVTTSSSLKRRKLEKGLRGNAVIDPFSIKIAELHLPHFVWVMEISPISIYRQGECTAEIVLDTTTNTLEDCLLYSRVGDKMILNNKIFSPTNSSTTLSTFAQYTHNLGEL